MKKKIKPVRLKSEPEMQEGHLSKSLPTKLGIQSIKKVLLLLIGLWAGALSEQVQAIAIIDSIYVDSLNDVALYELRYTNKDSALNVVGRSIQLATAKELKGRLGTAYMIEGLLYKDIGEVEKAYDAFIQGLEIRQKLNDRRGVAAAYNNLTIVERMRSNHGKALEYSNKAGEICKAINNIGLLARVYNNRGKVYRAIGDIEEATKWYKKTLAIAPAEDINTIAIANENLAETYFQNGDYQRALTYFEGLLLICEQDKDWESVARITNAIGAIYMKQEDFRKAKVLYKKSAAMAKQVRNDLLLGDAYINLSRLFYLNDQLDSASFYSERVRDLLEDDQDIGSLEDKRALAALFADIYEDNDDYENALVFARKAYEINEEVNNAERKKKLAEEEAKLGIAEQELKIKSQQNTILIVSLLGVLAMMGAYIFRNREKANREELKFLLETKDLEFANAKLKGEREGRERVARELHDDMSPKTVAIKRELELALKQLPEEAAAKLNIEDAIRIADAAYDKSRQLAYELRPKLLAWLDDIKLDLDQLERSSEIESEIIIHGIDNRINTTIGIEISKILTVLLHNVRKHAKASKISVDITRVNDEVVVIVEDDGIGFHASKEGLGLRSVKARVKDLKGTIVIDTQPQAGTTVIVNIPLI